MLIAAGGIYTVRNARKARDGASTSSGIRVAVKTNPPGASIRVNGEVKCTSDCNLELAAGAYEVQAVLPGAAQAAGDHLAVGCAHHQSAGEEEQVCTRIVFELVPEFVGAEEQGHVAGMLEVALPDHARVAVARAAVVSRGVTFEAENPVAAAGEGARGGAAHAAQACHDDVVGFHRKDTFKTG